MKEHLRMCIACRQKIDKKQLCRVVKSADGRVFLDSTGKADGRGAYVCSSNCIKKCAKSKLLNRAFRCEVTQEVYQALLDAFDGEDSHKKEQS